ncbi:uncharacterized protein Z520_01582 [Fonsecaea multimorphosa CBS 102226]|uniref:Uncharacterized protein n=1 Tax=Fonsecaea multimorphosa CBS 102226 TaxID=1442371 RepID=A0A0D2KI03_9EURO|nr:uncharacterized protein Z520_01582 [Fonsecaea multimorphosa CBS 102226]KIY03115.1 hypothetical protein Z520_01582 [Fonsecaea multimorphosa CBS 102226]
MPFRRSDLSRRNGPPPPPPPLPSMMMAPLPEPDRDAPATPASICYDNGTGRLHASLVQERGLPPYVQTTEQLAAFIKSQSRGQQQQHRDDQLSGSPNAPPSSFSPVGRSASVYSSSARGTFYHHSSGSYERLLRPAPVAAVADPFMVAAMRHRYGARPAVARILPGATRTHEYQGFWLRRGTTHRTESDKRGPAHKSSLKRSERKDYQVESSGQLV